MYIIGYKYSSVDVIIKVLKEKRFVVANHIHTFIMH